MANSIKPTRADLAKFLPDQRLIRAFEELFNYVPSGIVDASIDSYNSQTSAQQAIDTIESLRNAIELSSEAPDTAATQAAQIAELSQQVSLLSQAPPVVPHKAPRYGTFYDTTTQTAAAINTAYAVTFNSTGLSFGVSTGTPASRIYVDSEGVYNFQFSMQLDKVSGGVGLFYLWARINGVDQANSATQIRLQGNNAETVAAWNFVYKMTAGDYLELMWSVDTVDITIQAFTAAPPVPGIPSAILTVTNNIS
jgi:hypothetical protein